MKDFFYFFLFSPFENGDWLGYAVGILMWITTFATLFLLTCLVVWFIDASFMPIKEKKGVITNKEIIPEHTTTTYTRIGTMTVPQIHHHATAYNISIDIDGLTDDVEVSLGEYNSMYIGQIIDCKYTNGRILNSLYIKTYKVK